MSGVPLHARPGRSGPWAIALGALVVVGVPVCLIAGQSPLLPVVLAALAWLAWRPVPGLIYALIVLMAPLGLWMIRVDDFMTWAFGGRDYALSLSAAGVAAVLALRALIVNFPTWRQLKYGALAVLVFAVWVVIGVANHGLGQTASGARIILLPLLILIVAAGLGAGQLRLLVTVAAGLVAANGVASVVEYILGPAKLVSLGFKDGLAVRLIGDTFRAPGLTDINSALGLLAGAYLLGYAALWLVRGLYPRHLLWHVAAGCALVGLALSTGRSGALLLAAGLVGAIVLNRGGGAAARKRARVLGVVVVVAIVGGFVALGATGATSLFERFKIWGNLIQSGSPWIGSGVGGAGAATGSRTADTAQVFVDNYFVSVILQFGYPVAAVLVVLLIAAVVRLSRRSVQFPAYAVHLAVLTGLAAACLVIEGWEYSGAMAVLALFVTYAWKAGAMPAPAPQPHVPAQVSPAPAPAVPSPRPALDDTVLLDPSAAETVIMRRPPGIEDTVILTISDQPERYRR